MNAHELAKLLATVDDIDFEDLEDADPASVISPELLADIVAALEELQVRRKAAGDEHGLGVSP